MYSQNSEELFILDYFRQQPVGKFVDIGAYDVLKFSNTRALYEKGWGGVLVEPAPKNYKAISEHYQNDNRIIVLPFAIGTMGGEVEFWESDGDAVGTTNREHMKKWGAAGVKYEPIKVSQWDMETFAECYCHGCDFLSIDTESTNIEVFKAIPYWLLREIKMLCIEHDGQHEMIAQDLSQHGFSSLHVNAENIILAR